MYKVSTINSLYGKDSVKLLDALTTDISKDIPCIMAINGMVQFPKDNNFYAINIEWQGQEFKGIINLYNKV